jgi:tripartite-type tricarboxylate transporter receptor subunit TctC
MDHHPFHGPGRQAFLSDCPSDGEGLWPSALASTLLKEDVKMQRKFRTAKLVLGLLLIFSVLPFMGFECLHAQNFPTKPINIIIPYGPGGILDRLRNAISPLAPEYFGQPFVAHYREGGGGAIGSSVVSQARPDGYTVLMSNSNALSVLVAVTGRGKGPDDLTPICRLTLAYSAYWVQTEAPWKTFQEMIAWAKENPGKLSYGNTGTWSNTDFAWRLLEMKAGFTSRNVPFSGSEAMTALLGGHVQVSRIGSLVSFPHYRAGKIRPLAVAGSERLPELPGVPSLVEIGYDMGEVGVSWNGCFVPNGTSRPIMNKLAEGFKKMTQNKQAINIIKPQGIEFSYLGPDEFAKAWREEYLGYKELAKIFKK